MPENTIRIYKTYDGKIYIYTKKVVDGKIVVNFERVN